MQAEEETTKPTSEDKTTENMKVETLTASTPWTWASSILSSAKDKVMKLTATSTPINTSIPRNSNKDCPLLQLPGDVLFEIIGKLTAPNVGRLSSTCSQLYILCSQDRVWKTLYVRDQNKWNTFGSSSLETTAKTKLEKVRSFMGMSGPTPDPTTSVWKKRYIQLFVNNSREFKVEAVKPTEKIKLDLQRDESLLGKVKKSLAGKVYRVPMLGQGLELSAKRFVYNMMWEDKTPFGMNKLFAGTGGLGAGVGFKISGKQLNLCALYSPHDAKTVSATEMVGIGEKWFKLFEEADGSVYIVNNVATEENLSRTRHEFVQTFGVLERCKGPLLIFACKKEDSPHLSAKELADVLGLVDLFPPEKKWIIQIADVTNFIGMQEGFAWLAEEMK